MFSYLHNFHAGNFADIFKHTVLLDLLESLCKKDKPFTIIDTHAASGIYSLEDERLLKTAEAQNGILKLVNAAKALSTKSAFSLSPSLKKYLSFQEKFLSQKKYAGSPAIEEAFLRKGDTLFLIEKHPQALGEIKKNISKKAKILEADSFDALKALVPPLVKRGLIFMDPSYEEEDDYKKVSFSLTQAMKKWNTCTIALWYPLLEKRKNERSQMLSALEDNAKIYLTGKEVFKSELILFDPKEMTDEGKAHMYGSGMLIINAPYMIKEKVEETRLSLEKILK